MSESGLDKVRVLVAEGGTLRRQIKNVLNDNGFRQVAEAQSAKAVHDALAMNLVDLLIADNDLDGKLCSVIRDIRHFKLGANPFIVVIMVAGDLNRETTMEIIDAGADDLLIKPVTIGSLTDRVMALTRGRKKFVVTSDYIGPTRRTQAREDGEELPEIDVPNPVQEKATGAKSSDMDAAIVEATRLINLRKLERDAYQVVWLTDRILPYYGNGEPDPAVADLLDQLVRVSDEIGRRLKGTQFDHVGDLCGSLLTVAGGLQANPLAPPQRELKLLPELASAVRTALAGNLDEAGVARDIATTVGGAA